MRRCPKCGYVDSECWRPAAFHPWISYAYLDSLEVLEPEIFEIIKDRKTGKTIIHNEYVYWISPKSSTVRRAWIKDFEIYGKSVPQERVSHDPQLTLEGFQHKDDSINLLYVNHPKLVSENTTKEEH